MARPSTPEPGQSPQNAVPGDAVRIASRAMWDAVQLLTGANGLDPSDHLARLDVLTETIAYLRTAQVAEMRAARADDNSWREVGTALGLSKQGAQQYGARHGVG